MSSSSTTTCGASSKHHKSSHSIAWARLLPDTRIHTPLYETSSIVFKALKVSVFLSVLLTRYCDDAGCYLKRVVLHMDVF